MSAATPPNGEPLLRVKGLQTWFHVGGMTAKAVSGVSLKVK